MTREYLASVHSVDRNVARVLAGLGNLDLAHDTIVVFTSDNSMNMGHNGIWHKGNGRWILTDNKGDRPNLYDRSLRVPAAIRYLGRIKPGTIHETVSNLDWFPTLLSLAGIPRSDSVPIRGRDLTPLLARRPVAWNNDLYAEHRMHTGPKADMRAWRTPEWKLIRRRGGTGTDELYNLKLDPEDSTNRIDTDEPSARRALRDLSRKLDSCGLELGCSIPAEPGRPA
jgi:choline-sulfatase